MNKLTKNHHIFRATLMIMNAQVNDFDCLAANLFEYLN
jgi:hypothetical protein